MHKEEGYRLESYFSSEESDDGGDSSEYVSGGEEAVERESFARGQKEGRGIDEVQQCTTEGVRNKEHNTEVNGRGS